MRNAAPLCLALLLAALLLAPHPGSAQPATRELFPAAPHLSWALYNLTVGMTLDTAASRLRARGWRVLPARRLPDGPEDLIQAWPDNDHCLPAGTWLVCDTVNLYVVRDPALGPRLVRIDAFEPVNRDNLRLGTVLDGATRFLGPPAARDGSTDRQRGREITIARFLWDRRSGLAGRIELLVTVTPLGTLSPDPGEHDPLVEGIAVIRSSEELRSAILAAREAESCRLAPQLCRSP